MLKAHELVLGYARQAGVDSDSEEMQHFARNLFRLSRDAATRGMKQWASKLFDTAREINNRSDFEYAVFAFLAGVVGWRAAAGAANRFANLKRKARSGS
jgi:hypothetical protein